MKLLLVGASGLVGGVVLEVLKERGFENVDIILAASEKSVGKKVDFAGREISLVSVERALEMKPDVAIFSAGSAISKKMAPILAKQNCFVIDNSSAWRLDENIPLVIPEVNSHSISNETKIIANPNCSTIQLVVALASLHMKYKIKRLVISTYQSVSGTGSKAIEQLFAERENKNHEKVYPYEIDLNLLPHGGDFQEDGYTTEEQKLVDETRKILEDENIAITATVVRVPVIGGHSEAVNVEFYNDFDIDELRETLKNSQGIVVQDDNEKNIYPMPLFAHQKDDVFVGRIRRDFSQPNSLNMWVVSDNVRKGAATNAVQILEKLKEKNLVK